MSFIQLGDILPVPCPTCGGPLVAERYRNFWFKALPLLERYWTALCDRGRIGSSTFQGRGRGAVELTRYAERGCWPCVARTGSRSLANSCLKSLLRWRIRGGAQAGPTRICRP
jgi:hypothetical protein